MENGKLLFEQKVEDVKPLDIFDEIWKLLDEVQDWDGHSPLNCMEYNTNLRLFLKEYQKYIKSKTDEVLPLLTKIAKCLDPYAGTTIMTKFMTQGIYTTAQLAKFNNDLDILMEILNSMNKIDMDEEFESSCWDEKVVEYKETFATLQNSIKEQIEELLTLTGKDEGFLEKFRPANPEYKSSNDLYDDAIKVKKWFGIRQTWSKPRFLALRTRINEVYDTAIRILGFCDEQTEMKKDRNILISCLDMAYGYRSRVSIPDDILDN
jgi:hypothetical protein